METQSTRAQCADTKYRDTERTGVYNVRCKLWGRKVLGAKYGAQSEENELYKLHSQLKNKTLKYIYNLMVQLKLITMLLMLGQDN